MAPRRKTMSCTIVKPAQTLPSMKMHMVRRKPASRPNKCVAVAAVWRYEHSRVGLERAAGDVGAEKGSTERLEGGRGEQGTHDATTAASEMVRTRERGGGDGRVERGYEGAQRKAAEGGDDVLQGRLLVWSGRPPRGSGHPVRVSGGRRGLRFLTRTKGRARRSGSRAGRGRSTCPQAWNAKSVLLVSNDRSVPRADIAAT
ncbi:hypothetical protein AcW1_003850 [Taiwanofungus camphoratus]|nr:hypothetical protein AcW1_003850 [Antrodia cinnamomea]